MPGNTVVRFVCPLDCALEPAVGEGVLLVELQVALVPEEAISGLWVNVLDGLGGDDPCRELNKVLPSWLQLDALLLHHWKLGRLADEDLESVVVLVKSAKRNGIGVQVQCQSQTVSSSHF